MLSKHFHLVIGIYAAIGCSQRASKDSPYLYFILIEFEL